MAPIESHRRPVFAECLGPAVICEMVSKLKVPVFCTGFWSLISVLGLSYVSGYTVESPKMSASRGYRSARDNNVPEKNVHRSRNVCCCVGMGFILRGKMR